jgi:CBS domain-containing protein
MTNLNDYIVARDATLLDAIDVIDQGRVRTAIVVDDGKVVGVLSEGDILRALRGGADVHAPIADYMQVGFRYLRERDLGKAFALMHPRGITLVPLVDDGFRLQGVITLFEVMDMLRTRAGL